MQKKAEKIADKNANLDIDISVKHAMWHNLPFDLEDTVNEAVHLALINSKYSEVFRNREGEISIVLADNAFVQNLNCDYRHKDKPTNVLSFPQTDFDNFIDVENIVAFGDIILAYETIEKEAKEQNKEIQDHFFHLVVHGTLHLMGYDHETPGEAEEMENLEIDILKQIGIKNPYSDENFMA